MRIDKPHLLTKPSNVTHKTHVCRNHKNVTLTLSWNVIPNAGNLPRVTSSGSHSFKFPAEYTTSKA